MATKIRLVTDHLSGSSSFGWLKPETLTSAVRIILLELKRIFKPKT